MGAAPRVTVIGTDVERLASMADAEDQDRVQLVATGSPADSLSSTPADVIYLCENVPTDPGQYLAELAKVTNPKGCLLFSIRYHQGTLPSPYPGEDEPVPGNALSIWERWLIQAGFSQVEILDPEILAVCYTPEGELEFSVSDGLIKATKGGAV